VCLTDEPGSNPGGSSKIQGK